MEEEKRGYATTSLRHYGPCLSLLVTHAILPTTSYPPLQYLPISRYSEVERLPGMAEADFLQKLMSANRENEREAIGE